ncbi:MAG: hypothetical protein JWM31_2684 [Solirubrobacterales bacterium]|nr:hypothetical protein [Solirubrobacterales bacterium]
MSSAVADSTLRPLAPLGQTRTWPAAATSWFTTKPIDQRRGD